MEQQTCSCGASWLGEADDECHWCQEWAERQWQDKKADLLNPTWLQNQGRRYRELDEVTQQVWDTTRGIKRGPDVERKWMKELQDHLNQGLLSQQEMARALAKWISMKQHLGSFRKPN